MIWAVYYPVGVNNVATASLRVATGIVYGGVRC
jgi:hypothetical protein